MGDKFTDNIEYRIAQGEMRASEVYTKMMGYFGKDKARIKELEDGIAKHRNDVRLDGDYGGGNGYDDELWELLKEG